MTRYILLSLLLIAGGGIAGSVDSGEAVYERCALCHGLFGNSHRDKFPKLAGQNPRYLEKQIRDFISGRRTNDGGQMASVVTEISEVDIAVVVDWFASQNNPEAADDGSDTGALLFESGGCRECHTGERIADEPVPLLSTQHQSYLAKQMRDFRDRRRIGDESGLMHKQLSEYSDENIDNIAAFLAALDRQAAGDASGN